MKLCPLCMAMHKQKGWYLSPTCDSETNDINECNAHPRIENPRVIRTLKTIKCFCDKEEGYTHPATKIRPVTYENKCIHKRVLTTILFDYEVPFVEFLIQQEYVRQLDGQPLLIQMTVAGEEFLKGIIGESK